MKYLFGLIRGLCVYRLTEVLFAGGQNRICALLCMKKYDERKGVQEGDRSDQ